jgi:2-hydroxychromene-2-carboxylate isomerase
MSRKPRFYFSFHSPFSWMASHQVERRLPDAHEVLEYIPYFEPDEQTWEVLHARNIDMHYTSMSKAKHLYILQDTKRLSAKYGLSMKWPVDVDPWWVLPHHAYLAARRIGRGRDLYWALSEARWERGENICEVDVVRRIADSIGLDGDTLAKAPYNQDLRDEGIDALDKAYMDDVFGVPFFKMGPNRYWGLDRVDVFLDAFEKSRADAAAKEAAKGSAAGSAGAPARAVSDAADALAQAAQANPLAGVPVALLDRVGSYDLDTAGGCG